MSSLTAHHKLAAAFDFIEIGIARLPFEANVTIDLPNLNPNDIRELAKQHKTTFYHPGGSKDHFWTKIVHPEFKNITFHLTSSKI